MFFPDHTKPLFEKLPSSSFPGQWEFFMVTIIFYGATDTESPSEDCGPSLPSALSSAGRVE